MNSNLTFSITTRIHKRMTETHVGPFETLKEFTEPHIQDTLFERAWWNSVGIKANLKNLYLNISVWLSL